MTHQSFVEIFEDQFKVTFFTARDVLAGGIDAMGVRVEIDPARASLTLSTPIRDGHDGLPRSDLIDLLQMNVPNDLTGPFFLAERYGSGQLELRGTVPLASLAPAEVERLVLDHWMAALTIADQLDERFQARSGVI